MELGFMAFLAEPWFVMPWYAFGLAAAIWVLYDEYRVNRHVNAALNRSGVLSLDLPAAADR